MSIRKRQRLAVALSVLAMVGGLALLWWMADRPGQPPRGGFSDMRQGAEAENEALPTSDSPASHSTASATAGGLRGMVVSSDGQPVAGARVSIQLDRTALSVVASLTSDESGRFSALNLTYGVYSVVASKDGLVSDYVPAAVRANTPATELLLTLEAGATLQGTVRDSIDGLAVAACAIRTGLGDMAACDHAGRFILGPLAPGELSLLVSAPGYAPKQVSVNLTERKRSSADVMLTRGATVSGTVFDPQHQPFAGASVRSSHYVLGGLPPPEVAAISDAQGHFQLEGIAPGRANILAAAPGYAETQGVELVIGGGERREGIELVLTTGGAIIGTVVNEAGTGVAGATIQALRLIDKTVAGTASSLNDGSFRLDGLAAGKYTVVASVNGARAVSPGVTVVSRDESTVKLILGGDAIDGRVTTSAGAPVAGAEVTVVSSFAGGLGAETAVTDADGKFRVDGLVGAPFRVKAQAEHLGAAEQRGIAAGAHVELVLAGAGTIHGLVTSTDGHALENFEVHLVPQDGAQTGGVGDRYRMARIVSPDGAFRFDDVPVGRYGVRVKAAGYVESESGVDVTAGAVAEVTLSLSGGATVHGQVTLSGVPVQGCQIGPSSEPVSSDAQGDFTLTGLEAPEGHASIWADCPEGAHAWKRFDVPAGGSVDVTLEATAPQGGTRDRTNVDFAGVGMSIATQNGQFFAGSVFEGGPAFQAGIMGGDQILTVDGWSTQGASVMDVVNRIRGPIGMPVTIGILRPSTGAVFQAYAERSRIAMN